MLFEELHGVFTEAAKKVVELAFVRVVDAELVDSGSGLRRRGVSSRRRVARRGSGPGGGWKKSCGGKRLEQCSSVHGRDCSRGLDDVKRRTGFGRIFVGVMPGSVASSAGEESV